VHLDRHPEQRPVLHDDAALLRVATEEFVRAFAPAHAIGRTAVQDCELAGQQIRAGERVLVLYGSANRDDAVFDDADQIRLDRRPNPHAGFGLGIHRCLGSHLARTMFRIVLHETLDRLGDWRIRRDGAEHYQSIALIDGWVRIPCTFTPGPRRPVPPGLPEQLRS
jgi:cytochrome P450